MAKSPVSGISGVLGGLISSAPAPSIAATQSPPPPVVASAVPEIATNLKPVTIRTRARRGRPPRRADGPATLREKVTLRIDAALIEDYRDWSWTQRCQLGELVEKALSSYRKSR